MDKISQKWEKSEYLGRMCVMYISSIVRVCFDFVIGHCGVEFGICV